MLVLGPDNAPRYVELAETMGGSHAAYILAAKLVELEEADEHTRRQVLAEMRHVLHLAGVVLRRAA